jgi:hypothetical protein
MGRRQADGDKQHFLGKIFFEKGVDYWCFVCGEGCRTVAWPRRFSSHFLIRAAGKSLLLSSSSALSIHVSILLLQKYIYYYLVMRVCSYLCVLNFLDDLDRWY